NPQKRTWLVEKLREEAARGGKPTRAGAQAEGVAGRLDGTWELVSFERGGTRTTGKEMQALQLKLVIQGGRMTIYRAGERLGVHVVQLEPGKQPGVMRMTIVEGPGGPGTDKSQQARYEVKGDRLKLSLGNPGGPAPERFQTQSEMFEFRRVREEGE